ncbi:MAG: MerR family transcriptional regulator [Candidatus Rifleibacteriota bacterium]
MNEYLTITEVSRLTGLASHTLRYYEKQFPVILDVERTRGGHRLYRHHHLEALKSIIKLLKKDKLSIRAARRILGENDPDDKQVRLQDKNDDAAELNQTMALVLERLDCLCRSSERRDTLLEAFLRKTSTDEETELIEQITRCRQETKATMRMYKSLMSRWNKTN